MDKELEDFLKNNRLEVEIHFDFAPIFSWTLTITSHYIREDPQEVFIGQYYNYNDLIKALKEYSKKENNNG